MMILIIGFFHRFGAISSRHHRLKPDSVCENLPVFYYQIFKAEDSSVFLPYFCYHVFTSSNLLKQKAPTVRKGCFSGWMTVFLPRLVWWPKPGTPPKQAPYWKRLPELHRNPGYVNPRLTSAATMPGKTGRCKGETYETDVIGDSCRNRTGTASDTKAVTTAIMVVGKGSALPTGIGRFFGCDWMRQADLHRHGTAAFASMRQLGAATLWEPKPPPIGK